MTLTERDKKQLVILGVLILAFVFFTKDSFNRMKKSQEKRKHAYLMQTFAATGTATPAVSGAGAPAGGLAPQPSGIDPFSGRQITFGVGEGGSSYRLSGIVYNPKDRADSYAIINNEIVKIGEAIANTQMKLVDISSEEAVLSDGKTTVKLRNW